MTQPSYVRRYLDDLSALVAELDDRAITQAVEWLRDCGNQGKTIYSCGNGGSALIASQMVGDLVKQASMGREPRFKMIGLTDSVGTMLAYANDVDYSSIFVEPLKNFAQPRRRADRYQAAAATARTCFAPSSTPTKSGARRSG